MVQVVGILTLTLAGGDLFLVERIRRDSDCDHEGSCGIGRSRRWKFVFVVGMGLCEERRDSVESGATGMSDGGKGIW